jgi:hypothetical protein
MQLFEACGTDVGGERSPDLARPGLRNPQSATSSFLESRNQSRLAGLLVAAYSDPPARSRLLVAAIHTFWTQSSDNFLIRIDFLTCFRSGIERSCARQVNLRSAEDDSPGLGKIAKSNDDALAAFVASKAAIDAMFSRIQNLSNDHFGVAPDEVRVGLP